MKRLLIFAVSLTGISARVPAGLSADEVLARLESENQRRHDLLKEYSGSRQYTLQNHRFGKQAAVGVVMRYRALQGKHYTVITRSGSEKLNGVIDKVLASEASQSLPGENARHQITAANYRVRLAGTESAAGRKCYVLELSPRMKNRFLIEGKAWVDAASFAVVRIEGQFAASISLLVGAPRISEDFVEVQGFWLPGHVWSVTSSFLLGPTELDILFTNYQLDRNPEALAATVHRERRKLVTFAHSPATCNSQMQTHTTMTAFRIDLMLEAMGINRLIKYSPTPTMINVTTIFSRGILFFLPSRKVQSAAQSERTRRIGAIGLRCGAAARANPGLTRAGQTIICGHHPEALMAVFGDWPFAGVVRTLVSAAPRLASALPSPLKSATGQRLGEPCPVPGRVPVWLEAEV